MRHTLAAPIRRAVLLLSGGAIVCVSCAKPEPSPTTAGSAPTRHAPGPAAPSPVSTRGRLEVTAKLLEIPEGAIFKRDLYDYATVLKYAVLEVHRGQADGATIYVGQYNPFKPRSEASDPRVKEVGGNLKTFRAGQVHRMALEVPIDDFFMGGIVNKYFGQETGPIHWAIWTDLVRE